MIPELFVIPAPLIVREFVGVELTTKPLAPELKTIPLTSLAVESETLVMLETPKVAVSLGPSGTLFGVQLRAVFQSPLVGLRFQVALPAKADPASATNKDNIKRRNGRGRVDFTLLVHPKRGPDDKENRLPR